MSPTSVSQNRERNAMTEDEYVESIGELSQIISNLESIHSSLQFAAPEIRHTHIELLSEASRDLQELVNKLCDPPTGDADA